MTEEITKLLDGKDIFAAVQLAQQNPEFFPLLRHFAVDCAESVRHHMTDARSTAALDTARRHANGEATDEELEAAYSAVLVMLRSRPMTTVVAYKADSAAMSACHANAAEAAVGAYVDASHAHEHQYADRSVLVWESAKDEYAKNKMIREWEGAFNARWRAAYNKMSWHQLKTWCDRLKEILLANQWQPASQQDGVFVDEDGFITVQS